MDKGEIKYRICIKEHLSDRWNNHFSGFSISREFDKTGTPITAIEGPITDQAQLHGIIGSLRDMGLTLLNLNQINEE